MMLDLIDIGANLSHDSFDEDRADVIRRAADAGVRRIIITGSSEQDSAEAAELAGEWPGRFYSTAGVHPHHASEYADGTHEALVALSHDDAVVAIGECGLDYFRNFSPPDAQRTAFRRQLDLAAQTGLPVFLHQRDAHADFLEILEPAMSGIAGGVAHCFTGDTAALEAYLDLGLHIGITGWICDERRGEHLRSVVPKIPPDRLMIETDAPYLLPRTLEPRPKSRRNEPMHLREVLKIVAESTGESEESVARRTTANAERFFGLNGTL